MKETFDTQKITDRLEDIERAIEELGRFKAMSSDTFKQGKDNYPIAAFWLRTALESVITIGTHILSHMQSNGKKKDYTRVIESLGEHDIIPRDFSERIRGMAGYRNRLVHMYWEVSSDELHTILQTRVDDLVNFGEHIRNFMKGLNK